MLKFITIFALVNCAFGRLLPQPLDGRILHGVDSIIEDYPYQVSLQDEGYHFCGGSIINEDTIVTAAHCLEKHKDLSKLRVRIGSTYVNRGGQLVAVSAVRIHKNYDKKHRYDNDIAVMKLAAPVKESASVRYIQLAKKSPQDETPAVITGWGDDKCILFFFCESNTAILQSSQTKIITQKTCAAGNHRYVSTITENMLCAADGKKDTCQGDSGGPLAAGGELVGVVSWGIGCGLTLFPGIYADVAVLHDWIITAANYKDSNNFSWI